MASPSSNWYKKITINFVVAALLAATGALAYAQDKLLSLDTRPGISVRVYYMKRDGAPATVVLVPGGSGGIGVRTGVPKSENFLVRSRDHFAAGGFNVAVVGRPSDQKDLDYEFRVSPQHVEDLRRVVAYLKRDTGLLRAAGLELTAVFPYVLAEVGTADFWVSGVEAYRRFAAQSGQMSKEYADAWAARLVKDAEEGIFFGASNFYAYVTKRA